MNATRSGRRRAAAWQCILWPALAGFIVSSALAESLPPQAPGPSPAVPVLQRMAGGEGRYDLAHEIFRPVRARHGMVASEQHLATRVGVDILKRGGNAVDAAVAVGFALAVVLPVAGNLGGGGFMLIHEAATGRQVAIDFREMAPAAAGPDLFLDAAGEVVPGRSLETHRAVGIPGSVAGLAHAQARYGTLPLAELVAPARQLASQGFVVSAGLAEVLAARREQLARWPATRAIFFRQGEPLKAGDRLVQPDLARSLAAIARHGAAGFYRGPTARRIADEMARHGGLIGAADLARYRVVERAPVVAEYRGYRIVSMPPPSSGGAHIAQILNLLEPHPLARLGAGSAAVLHLEAEAMKLAYADRAQYLGDPDFVAVPLAGITSKAYAGDLGKRLDPERATPSAAIRPGRPQDFESEQTTHVSVADRHGNAVAMTTTLNLAFGSGIVVPGTGILLNNQMDDFAARPGAANAFGLTGGVANRIEPFKRPLSSMSPTLVLAGGRPWAVTGSPGGSRIITATVQTLINLIDHGMNPAEAAAAPRIHHQWQPDELRIEKGISPDTLRLLAAMGHRPVLRPTMGRTQTIRIDADGFAGASDPRGADGMTSGY